MRADLLLKLAEFLETMPKERFFYGTWVGHDWGGDPNYSCGTTACALGWAATIPEIAAEGLHMVLDDYRQARPVYGDERHFCDSSWDLYAAVEVFKISYKQAEHLFIPSYGEPEEDPSWVAKKIRKLVAAGDDWNVAEAIIDVMIEGSAHSVTTRSARWTKDRHESLLKRGAHLDWNHAYSAQYSGETEDGRKWCVFLDKE